MASELRTGWIRTGGSPDLSSICRSTPSQVGANNSSRPKYTWTHVAFKTFRSLFLEKKNCELPGAKPVLVPVSLPYPGPVQCRRCSRDIPASHLLFFHWIAFASRLGPAARQTGKSVLLLLLVLGHVCRAGPARRHEPAVPVAALSVAALGY